MKRPEMVVAQHSPFESGLVPYFVIAYAWTWAFHIAMPVLGMTATTEGRMKTSCRLPRSDCPCLKVLVRLQTATSNALVETIGVP